MKVDWVIFGTGYMAQNYCRAITSQYPSDHIYMVSRNAEDARLRINKINEMANKNIEVEEYKNLKFLINTKVLICTPVSTHHEYIKKLSKLSSVQNIFCEKPIFSNSQELFNSKSYGKGIFGLYNRRFFDTVKQFKKEMTEAGYIHCLSCYSSKETVDSCFAYHVLDTCLWLCPPKEDTIKIIENNSSIISFQYNSDQLYGTEQMLVRIDFLREYINTTSITCYIQNGKRLILSPLEEYEKSQLERKKSESKLQKTFLEYVPSHKLSEFMCTTDVKPGLSKIVSDIRHDELENFHTLNDSTLISKFLQKMMEQ